jgi:hypothetical protein
MMVLNIQERIASPSLTPEIAGTIYNLLFLRTLWELMVVFNIQEDHRFVWRGSHLPHVSLMVDSEIARAVNELVRERLRITTNTST